MMEGASTRGYEPTQKTQWYQCAFRRAIFFIGICAFSGRSTTLRTSLLQRGRLRSGDSPKIAISNG